MGYFMKEAYTTTASMVLGDDGILRITIKEGASVQLEDAKNHYRVTQRLLNDQKGLVLLDGRANYSISIEAKAYIREMNAKTRIATAVLVGSRTSKHLTNFVLSFSGSPVPTRSFTDKQEAENWLLGFKAK
jgi:hypothetical protein